MVNLNNKQGHYSVYCIENPLMDYISREGYERLPEFHSKSGTMQLVDYATFDAVRTGAPQPHKIPGGSGANTIRALAMLLGSDAERMGRLAYSGGIGDDETGRIFASILNSLGVETALAKKELPSGGSAIIVTPDHERTMFTYLGACRDFAPEDVKYNILENSRIFYTTGYMWDTEKQKEAVFAAVDRACALSIPVCFDLADPFVVDRYFLELRQWMQGRMQVIFANRDELSRLTDCTLDDETIIRRASGIAPLMVMKVGKKGCYISENGKITHVPGEVVEAKDTTGAGDSFAAGFLYGLLSGKNAYDCARIGNRIASRVVQVEGCRYDLLKRDEILSILN